MSQELHTPPRAASPFDQVFRTVCRYGLLVLVIVAFFLLLSWPAASWTRLAGMLGPTGVALLVLGTGRARWSALGVSLGAGILLGVLAYWFLPTLGGITYWQATGLVANVKFIPEGKWDEFCDTVRSVQRVTQQFPPALKQKLAREVQEWVEQSTQQTLADIERLGARQPAAATVQLQELEQNLRSPSLVLVTKKSLLEPHRTGLTQARERLRVATLAGARQKVATLKAEGQSVALAKLLQQTETEYHQLLPQSEDGPAPEDTTREQLRQFKRDCAEAALGKDLARSEDLLRAGKLEEVLTSTAQMQARQPELAQYAERVNELRFQATTRWLQQASEQLVTLEKGGKPAELTGWLKRLEKRMPDLHPVGDEVQRLRDQAMLIQHRWEMKQLEEWLAAGKLAEVLARFGQFQRQLTDLAPRAWHNEEVKTALQQHAQTVQRIVKARLDAAAVELTRWQKERQPAKVAALAKELDNRWHRLAQESDLYARWEEVRRECWRVGYDLRLGQLADHLDANQFDRAGPLYQVLRNEAREGFSAAQWERLTALWERLVEARLSQAEKTLKTLSAFADQAELDRLLDGLEKDPSFQSPRSVMSRDLEAFLSRATLVLLETSIQRVEALATRNDFRGARDLLGELRTHPRVTKSGAAQQRLQDLRREATRGRLEAARGELVSLLKQDDYAGLEHLVGVLQTDWSAEASQSGVGTELTAFVQQAGVLLRLARTAGKIDQRE